MQDKETVHWQYVKLLDCFEIIDELEDGAEIYSRHIVCPQGTTTDEMIKRYFPEELVLNVLCKKIKNLTYDY
nr:DUF4288 domain-containing protein [Bacillus andreraoultii]